MANRITALFIGVFLLLVSLPAEGAPASSFDSVYNAAGQVAYIATMLQSKGELKKKTVVIDPGHGGSDTGAIGLNGVREKDVTLAVGLELRQLLAAAGAKVLMTRTTDRDVAFIGATDVQELAARSAIANKAGADLFISLHADAFADHAARGSTIYYFPKTNADELLAESIQYQLSQSEGLFDRGSQENDFYVLDHTEMPSALVEMAFISNPDEEKLLRSKAFQKKAALGIYKGLLTYFRKTG